ncbi:MAG: EpsG family protein [Paludibacteraceae bacterium]|nr:EpsG family protein [Paludibacteraceae bacterium]
MVIAFTFVEGARYGRGVDYMHYIDVYKHDLEKSQVLFSWYNNVLKTFGVPPEYAFGFYALPFITCGLFLLKEMKMYARFMFPFFLLCFIGFHEAFIRQAFSFSFYFLYITQLYNIIRSNGVVNPIEYFFLLLVAVASVSIHSIAVVAIIATTIIMLFVRRPIHWIFTIPLLLFGKFYLATHFDWSYINNLLIFLSNDDKLADYAGNADRWFSDDAMREAYTRNVLIEALETWGAVALLYLGYKVCVYLQNNDDLLINKKNTVNINVALFNVSVVGMLVLQTFYNLEIIRRVAYNWYLLWFVPFSLVIFYRKNKDVLFKLDKILAIGFFYWIWEYIRFLFVFTKERMFIWDM